MAEGPLAGRVAVITGASSGIGAATATALSKAGAAVALVARRQDRLEALAEAVGGPVSIHPADLSDEAAARAAIEAVHAEHGALHLLINNAGVMLLGPVQGADISEWRRMLDVNLWALLICTHAALPLIAGSGGGDIVNVSSVAGRRADAGAAVYNITKFGVHGFSEALRQEALHAGVRVTTVDPASWRPSCRATTATRSCSRPWSDRASRSARCCEAEDVADGILFAVSQPRHVCLNEVLVRPTNQAR